jgi:hypothetical protein
MPEIGVPFNPFHDGHDGLPLRRAMTLLIGVLPAAEERKIEHKENTNGSKARRNDKGQVHRTESNPDAGAWAATFKGNNSRLSRYYESPCRLSL